MAKQTKRSRKFQASGGVKARIEKGTITKHGKLRKRKNKHDYGENRTAMKKQDNADKTTTVDRSDDLTGKSNVGDLDMDGFFAQFDDDDVDVDHDDEKLDDMDEDKAEVKSSSSSSSSSESSSSDDSSSENENEKGESNVKDKKSNDDDHDDSSSSSNSDSDEEDIDALEAKMKEEMSKIKESDPEFHNFLKENEESLLEFGAADEMDEKDNDDDDDEEESKEKSKSTNGEIVLTPQLLAKIAKGAFIAHGIKNLKKLVRVYRSACYMSDSTSNNNNNSKSKSGDRSGQQVYIIESSKLFDKLMVMCLDHLHEAFNYHLIDSEKKKKKKSEKESSNDDNDNDDDDDNKDDEIDMDNKPLNPKVLEKASKWSDLKQTLYSFFRSTLHILAESKEPQLLSFILKALGKYIKFLTPFPRLAESMLKSLTELWSAPLDSKEDYQIVRLNAFFRIRQLALTQPFPFIENVLKKTYLAYARRAKFGASTMNNSSPVLPTLTFMGNCLVELYSLDYQSSYQHAFVYIRQLALLLRTAIQKKTIESRQQVYCWQYVYCMKLWVAILSSAAQADDGALMRSLIFPLTEIIQGTVRFVPSPVRYLPYYFHGIRLLQQLASCSETFIPTTSLLFDILDWKEWYMPPKKTKSSSQATRGIQMQMLIKFGKEDPLRTHEQREAGINELFILLNREIELYKYSAGIPEYTTHIIVRMRAFIKDIRDSRWKAYARGCIDICDKYTKFAISARSKLQDSPKDVKMLECIKPISEKSMRIRHELSVEKEMKVLESTFIKDDDNKKKRSMQEEVSSDEESEDSSEEEKEKNKKKKKSNNKKRAKVERKKSSKEDLETKMLSQDALLKEKDEVAEGIAWSDDDEDED